MTNYRKIIDNINAKTLSFQKNEDFFSKKEFEKNRPIIWKIIGKIFPEYRNYPFHNLTKFKNLEEREIDFLNKIKKINGMSTLTNALLINQLCQSIGKKNYVNIGCWEGFSLISGMINTNCNVYGVDNFSQFNGPSEKFYKNFNKYKKKIIFSLRWTIRIFFLIIGKKKIKK